MLKFTFKNNVLCLSEFKKENNTVNYREYDVLVKLKSLEGYNILSVKKTRDMLQSETLHNKKKNNLP